EWYWTRIVEKIFINKLFGESFNIRLVKIIYAGGSMMRFNEINNLFRQSGFSGHLHTFRNMGNDNLCALLKGKSIMRIISFSLVLYKILRICNLPNVMIQCACSD